MQHVIICTSFYPQLNQCYITFCFICPTDNSTGDEDDSDLSEEDTSGEEGGEEEGEEEEDALPVYLWKPSQTTDMLGDWEVHTKVRTCSTCRFILMSVIYMIKYLRLH